MAFTRQSINNTSNFSVDGQGVTESITIPTFRRWENTTKDTQWELGQGWTLNVPNDHTNIYFSLNNKTIWTIGIDGDGNIDTGTPVLSLENYENTQAIPSGYSGNGLLARVNGELYMSTPSAGPIE